MKIKIIQCSISTYWYHDKIGQIYAVQFMDGKNYVVDTPNEEFVMGSVLPQDCEVVV